MKDNFEVITTTDKAKRDEMFTELRANGNRLEKQVVKFSSSEPVMTHFDGLSVQRTSILPNYAGRMNKLSKSAAKRGQHIANQRVRPHHVSTWSIAYPSS